MEMETLQQWNLCKTTMLDVYLFDRIGLVAVRAAHAVVPLPLLRGHLQEPEVELLHVGALQPAGLLLAAVLVDAVLNVVRTLEP